MSSTAKQQAHRRKVTPELFERIHSLRRAGKTRSYIKDSVGTVSFTLIDQVLQSNNYKSFYRQRLARQKASILRNAKPTVHKVPVVDKHIKAIGTAISSPDDYRLVRVAGSLRIRNGKKFATQAYTRAQPTKYAAKQAAKQAAVSAPTKPTTQPASPPSKPPYRRKALPAISLRPSLADMAASKLILDELKLIREAVSKPRGLFSRLFR